MRSTRFWTAGLVSLAAAATAPGSALAQTVSVQAAAKFEAHAAVSGDRAKAAASKSYDRAKAFVARAQHELDRAAKVTIALEQRTSASNEVAGAQAAASFDAAATADSAKMSALTDRAGSALDRVAKRAMAHDLSLEAAVSISSSVAVEGSTPATPDAQGKVDSAVKSEQSSLQTALDDARAQADKGSRESKAGLEKAIAAGKKAKDQLSSTEASIESPGDTSVSASASASASADGSNGNASASGESNASSSGGPLTATGHGLGDLAASTRG